MSTKTETHTKSENDWRCVCGTCHICSQPFDRPYRNYTANEGCVCTCHDGAASDHKLFANNAKTIRRRQTLAWTNGYGNSKRTGVICNF